MDSPWRRLHWTLPLALLICAVTFSLFAYSMWRPVIRSPDPVPVTAELVELPAPEQPQPQVRQKTMVQPRIEPALQPEQRSLPRRLRSFRPSRHLRPASLLFQ